MLWNKSRVCCGTPRVICGPTKDYKNTCTAWFTYSYLLVLISQQVPFISNLCLTSLPKLKEHGGWTQKVHADSFKFDPASLKDLALDKFLFPWGCRLTIRHSLRSPCKMLDRNHNPAKNRHLLFQIPVIRNWKCWFCGPLVVAQEAISLIYF